MSVRIETLESRQMFSTTLSAITLGTVGLPTVAASAPTGSISIGSSGARGLGSVIQPVKASGSADTAITTPTVATATVSDVSRTTGHLATSYAASQFVQPVTLDATTFNLSQPIVGGQATAQAGTIASSFSGPASALPLSGISLGGSTAGTSASGQDNAQSRIATTGSDRSSPEVELSAQPVE